MSIITTERLRLRQWRDSDCEPFAAMVADSKVMEFFPNTLNRAQSDALIDRLSRMIDQYGYGFWAAERLDTSEFIGFIGINYLPASKLHFSPNTDIGWRLAPRHWRKGFATEGALAALEYGFSKAGLDEIVSMTPVLNVASEGVMKKIGMQNSGENFYHPEVPLGHSLAEHVLYRITGAEWFSSEASKP